MMCWPRLRWLCGVVTCWLLTTAAAHAEDTSPARVWAASSLVDVLGECIRVFEARGGNPPVLGLAASSKLARQVEQGASAHLVITADAAWMDHLEAGGHLSAGSRILLARNQLALVVPNGSDLPIHVPADLAQPAMRHVAVAAEAVPAGRRAREALTAHGLLSSLTPRLVVGSHARAPLALVARAEVDAALVYATDAAISSEVEVRHVFSPDDHQPIVYPLALTPTGAAHPGARAFYDFLQGPIAAELFSQAGFQTTVTAAAGIPAWRGRIDVPQGSYGPITLSLWVAASSLLLSLVPGVAIGWLLARRAFFGRTALLIMVMVPLVLPPVVTGYLLLQLFGRHGLFAPVLATLGLEVAFGRWGAVLAAAVVGFPLLVQVTRQAFEAVDPRYEHIASTLGRHPVSVFFTVTLPMAAPGIAAGAVLAFARGLGEFGATAVLAGDVPGETRTIALALFAAYEQPGQEAAASQLVWIAVALSSAALVGYELLSRAQQRRLALR